VTVAPGGGELTLEPTWLRRGVGCRAVAPARVSAEAVFILFGLHSPHLHLFEIHQKVA
jgi:hypothetical protein